jgi:hypothetical protein
LYEEHGREPSIVKFDGKNWDEEKASLDISKDASIDVTMPQSI